MDGLQGSQRIGDLQPKLPGGLLGASQVMASSILIVGSISSIVNLYMSSLVAMVGQSDASKADS